MQEHGDFPERAKPDNIHPDIDTAKKLSFISMSDELEKIRFSLYRPSDYITSAQAKQALAAEKKALNFNQTDREKYLVAMMNCNLVKRLESSAHALQLTLKRVIGKIDDLDERMDKYLKRNNPDNTADIHPDENDAELVEDDDFVVNRKAMTKYEFKDLDIPRWRADIQRDRVPLQKLLDKISAVEPKRDAKLDELKQIIAAKAKQPNPKLLVFTAFKDTADYLYDNLINLAAELNIGIATVSGGDNRATRGAKDYDAILNNFSPRARLSDSAANGATPNANNIDLLIATDCVSEGQNLQDCDQIVNYDIHWNPIKITHRFGRIDRLGSQNNTVKMTNFWPVKEIEDYLNLEQRVRARMALANVIASGDDDTLNRQATEQERAAKTAVQMELDFRHSQLKYMKDNPPDLDAADEKTVAIGDFTLNYFIAQLLRYIQANEKELQKTPPGSFAVVNAKDAGIENAGPGAVFLFKHTADKDAPKCGKNPIQPHYIVYADYDNRADKFNIRYSYMSAGAALRAGDKLAGDKNKPLDELAKAVEQKILTAEGKNFYNQLANAALKSVKTNFNSNINRNLGADRNAVTPVATDAPSGANLTLVAWLAIETDQPVRPDQIS